MRSCHPGPSCWKNSSTSWSIRKVMLSFAPGMEGACAGHSMGLVVAFLKAASAALKGSVGLRPPGDLDMSVSVECSPPTIGEIAGLRQIGKAASVSTKSGRQVQRLRNET